MALRGTCSHGCQRQKLTSDFSRITLCPRRSSCASPSASSDAAGPNCSRYRGPNSRKSNGRPLQQIISNNQDRDGPPPPSARFVPQPRREGGAELGRQIRSPSGVTGRPGHLHQRRTQPAITALVVRPLFPLTTHFRCCPADIPTHELKWAAVGNWSMSVPISARMFSAARTAGAGNLYQPRHGLHHQLRAGRPAIPLQLTHARPDFQLRDTRRGTIEAGSEWVVVRHTPVQSGLRRPESWPASSVLANSASTSRVVPGRR